MTAPVPIALVEDHEGTRTELMATMAAFSERVRLVSAFRDAESFLASAALQRVSVALVDLGLPRMSGVDLVRRLGEVAPHVRAVALTAFEDRATVLRALEGGAHGYLLKDEPVERVIRAVEEAAEGEHPVSARVVGFLISQVRKSKQAVTLTFREEELAVLLAEGLGYAECAEKMGIGVGTVQTYVKTLYRKLEVSSRAEVRDWVRRHRESE